MPSIEVLRRRDTGRAAVKSALVACSLVSGLMGCGGRADPPSIPDGGIYVFDGAMLARPDAPSIRSDGGPPLGTDAGPAARVDAGRDAGSGGSCSGSAWSCSTVGTLSCAAQLGCRLAGDCGGSATSCYSLFTSFDCYDQDGCYWSTSSRNCSGFARSCSGYGTSVSCRGQSGCRWSDRCDGFPSSCFGLSYGECVSQLGCYWD